MLYEYQCPEHGSFAVYQHADGQHEHCACPDCETVSARIWSAPYTSVDHTESHYNHGLGCVVSSKADIKSAQSRYYDRHGSRLIDTGGDRYPVSRKRTEYETARQLGIA